MYPSEFTVSENKIGQIILVALTAHYTPTLTPIPLTWRIG